MGKDKKKYKEIKNVKEVEETVFDKDQLVSSKKFMNNKDVLSVLIEDGEKITIEEAQKRIETFKKRKVK